MKTTNEMDGLLLPVDIANKHKAMLQCRKCRKWTMQDRSNPSNAYKPCTECGNSEFDPTSAKSIRTYNPINDAKRKVK